jgi:hypothetical protein
MLPTKFRLIWPSGFGGVDLKKSTNQKQELPVAAMFVNESRRKSNLRDEMSNLHRGSRSVNKHGHHRPFLFLIGRFLKIFFSVTA